MTCRQQRDTYWEGMLGSSWGGPQEMLWSDYVFGEYSTLCVFFNFLLDRPVMVTDYQGDTQSNLIGEGAGIPLHIVHCASDEEKTIKLDKKKTHFVMCVNGMAKDIQWCTTS